MCAGPLCDGVEFDENPTILASSQLQMKAPWMMFIIEPCVGEQSLTPGISHQPRSRPRFGGCISLASTSMTDKRLQSSKLPSKGFLKKPVKWVKETFSRSQSRSTSPQPSASGQENRDGEISLVQHGILSLEAQEPVIGASAAISQQGIFMYRRPIDEALSPICRSSYIDPIIGTTQPSKTD